MRLKWQVKAIFVQLLWIMGRADKGGSKGEGRRGQKCREGITIAEMDVVALNDCWHGMAIWAAAKIWLCLWTQPKAVAFQFPSPFPSLYSHSCCIHISVSIRRQWIYSQFVSDVIAEIPDRWAPRRRYPTVLQLLFSLLLLLLLLQLYLRLLLLPPAAAAVVVCASVRS